MSVQRVQIDVPQATLDDLRERLARTGWPDEVEGAGWEYSTNLGYMRELADYWQHTTWSDCDGDIEKRFTKDELLTNIMLHWVAGIDPRGYREEWVSPSLKPDQSIDVPVGLALPPNDLTPVPPRVFAERTLKNIQRWTVLPHGGHFVAMEDPEPLAEDMRAFFRPLRAAS